MSAFHPQPHSPSVDSQYYTMLGSNPKPYGCRTFHSVKSAQGCQIIRRNCITLISSFRIHARAKKSISSGKSGYEYLIKCKHMSRFTVNAVIKKEPIHFITVKYAS